MASLRPPISLIAGTRRPPPPLPNPGSVFLLAGVRVPKSQRLRLHLHLCPNLSCSGRQIPEEGAPGTLIEDLRVPDFWLLPPNALKESEWLRVTLNKWLDDEYCPELANIEISKLAARSYYESLTSGQADLGEILLKMVRDLETISYQESFHGAFSSANAAVHLITLRIHSVDAADA